ncbi:MAG: hypothetical protein A2571_02740 [Candidatus Vogelbacteria bacterium RIFOXYD1_FULL_44_32]|uniref:Guanylate kinase-like domain-containing protein n=1 Tax=Candidatus Vogelbacteria bacterium RIFOXYD1_FULL_44_32 TaxID=1802438 RepID=A0A1G2QF79_9BACT|nr:MAG: hypothetical protein A2571_02740 [Candidatus Vogelbacteria bacterium RIFOXYD1_FULL_44_32]
MREMIQVGEVAQMAQPKRFRWHPEKDWPRKGHILIPSGTMGSGKSTVLRILLREYNGSSIDEDTLRAASRYFEDDLLSAHYGLAPKFRLIPSHTTRPERAGDFRGEYIHHTEAEFKALSAQGEFAWVVTVGQYLYGTTVEDIHLAITQPVVGILTATPETILQCLEVTWIDQGDIVPLYIDSPHRVEWMGLRGGLTESELEFREARNKRWDTMVAHSGIGFWRIENCHHDILLPVVKELAHVISKMKRQY